MAVGLDLGPVAAEGLSGAGPDLQTMEGDPVDLGVELLGKLEHEEVPLAAAVDRLETITTDPAITRRILEAAEAEGIIEREGTAIRPQSGAFVRFTSEVITKDGEFNCRRCGTALTTGYFIELDTGELGPYGSSCIHKVTGRE